MQTPNFSYIIPPRLKSRTTFYGFHPEELAIIFLFFFGGLLQKLYFSGSFLLVVAATLTVLWLRPSGGRNVYSYLKLLLKFYAKPQVFTLKENRYENENQ